MKNIIALILLSFAVHGQYISTETLAIPYFNNNTENSEYAWLSEALADMLTTDIAATKKIWVVNRLDLKKVLEEQKFSLSGLVSDSSMVTLGNRSGASLILTGSFTIYGDQIRVDAKVFNLETGTSQGAASIIGSIQDIFVLEKKLAVQALAALSIPLSEDDKINLFQIASGNIKAIENNYRGVIALEKDDRESAKQYFKKAVNEDPYYRNAQVNLDGAIKAIDGGGLFTASMAKIEDSQQAKKMLVDLFENYPRNAFRIEYEEPNIKTGVTDKLTVSIPYTITWNMNFIHDFEEMLNKIAIEIIDKEMDSLSDKQKGVQNENKAFHFGGKTYVLNSSITKLIKSKKVNRNKRGSDCDKLPQLITKLQTNDGTTISSTRKCFYFSHYYYNGYNPWQMPIELIEKTEKNDTVTFNLAADELKQVAAIVGWAEWK